MSKCMVRLTSSQLRCNPVSHSLFEGINPPLSESRLYSLVSSALGGSSSARNELVVGHLAMLQHTVGRYLYHWPMTRRFLDEMVSAGVYGMVHSLEGVTEASLEGKTIGVYLLQHIYKHIEAEICSLRGIAPAPVRTNQRRVQDGLPPIFGEVVCDITPSKATADHSYTEAGFESIEAEEVINQLRTEFQKLDIMFNCENWDKSNRELSDLTGVPRRTVHWCRQELLRRYREMTA